MREQWTKEEMILTLYIYLTHDSEELHKSSNFLIEFCDRLNKFTGLKRTPSSIEMRISNYKSVDPNYTKVGLANGGKSVLEYWEKYHQELKYMENLYSKFVNETFVETSEEAKQELIEIVNQLEYKTVDIEGKDSYIESVINMRNGEIQKIFKNNLNVEFNQKCALCNIKQKNLLIGSHILPYSKCKDKTDMINHYNGLLLCPNHDALFDKKLITFDEDGKIIISCKIDKNIYKDLNINPNMFLEKKYLTSERIEFLKEHIKLFDKKN